MASSQDQAQSGNAAGSTLGADGLPYTPEGDLDIVALNNRNRRRPTRPGWRALVAFIAFIGGMAVYVSTMPV